MSSFCLRRTVWWTAGWVLACEQTLSLGFLQSYRPVSPSLENYQFFLHKGRKTGNTGTYDKIHQNKKTQQFQNTGTFIRVVASFNFGGDGRVRPPFGEFWKLPPRFLLFKSSNTTRGKSFTGNNSARRDYDSKEQQQPTCRRCCHGESPGLGIAYHSPCCGEMDHVIVVGGSSSSSHLQHNNIPDTVRQRRVVVVSVRAEGTSAMVSIFQATRISSSSSSLFLFFFFFFFFSS